MTVTCIQSLDEIKAAFNLQTTDHLSHSQYTANGIDDAPDRKLQQASSSSSTVSIQNDNSTLSFGT